LATDFPQVKELSIDPYLVGPVGTEAMVVDARMTLFGDPGPPSRSVATGSPTQRETSRLGTLAIGNGK
jgi:hypothetical protein